MNLRGQAILEALVAAVLMISLFFIVLLGFLKLTYSLVVTEIFEQYAICQTDNEKNCMTPLKLKLEKINIKDFKLSTKNETIHLHIHSKLFQTTLESKKEPLRM